MYYNVREDGMDGVFSTQGEKCIAYKVLVGKPNGKRELERRRRRWQDNIKMSKRVKYVRRSYTGLIWLRTGSSGEALVNTGGTLSDC